MASAFDIKILWSVFNDIVSYLTKQEDKKRESLVEAHKSINTAFIQTYDYLKNKNGQYVPNILLAEIWNQASASVMRVDKELGEMLYHKSRFWLDPQLYINLNRDSEIIELIQIVEQMERLRIRLQ